MTYLDDKRLNLIYELLGAKMQASMAMSSYQSATHNYAGQNTLHMREAHFITSIHPGETRTMSSVAEALAVTQSAASQTASRLEKKGLICRTHSPQDRRIVLVSLTEKGEEFYREHLAYDTSEFQKIDQQVTSCFTNEELEMLTNYEKRMNAYFIGNCK